MINIIYHHHQRVSTAWIPWTLSHNLSLSVIVFHKLKADECKLLLVGEHWCVHVLESIEEHHLSVQPFLLQELAICFAHLYGMVCVMGDKWPHSCSTGKWFSKIHSKQHAVSLHNSHLFFFSQHFITIQVVQLNRSTDLASAFYCRLSHIT